VHRPPVDRSPEDSNDPDGWMFGGQSQSHTLKVGGPPGRSSSAVGLE
jgi:hypothetical protein